MSPTRLILVFCLLMISVFSFKRLSDEQIPKNYQLGKIKQLCFNEMQSMLFFITENREFGYLRKTQGMLDTLFQLEENEQFVEIFSEKELIISNGLEIYVYHITEKYMDKLFLSAAFSLSNFTTIESYVRTDQGYYILNEQSLVFYDKETRDRLRINLEPEIIVEQNPEQQEVYWTLFQLKEEFEVKQELLMISFKNKEKESQICFRLITKLSVSETKCSKIENTKEPEDIVQSGKHIYVEFAEETYIFNNKFELLEAVKERPKQYHLQFVTMKNDHYTYLPTQKKKLEWRVISDYQKTSAMRMKVNAKSMEIYKDQEKIGEISKTTEVPKKIWSKKAHGNTDLYEIVVEYQNTDIAFFNAGKNIPTERIWFKDHTAEVGKVQIKEEVKPIQIKVNKEIEAPQKIDIPITESTGMAAPENKQFNKTETLNVVDLKKAPQNMTEEIKKENKKNQIPTKIIEKQVKTQKIKEDRPVKEDKPAEKNINIQKVQTPAIKVNQANKIVAAQNLTNEQTKSDEDDIQLDADADAEDKTVEDIEDQVEVKEKSP